MVTGLVPSPPRFLPSIFIAHRAQQSHCSSIFYRMLLTHALALSASQFVPKKNSQRVNTSMHSVGLELTKLIDTRLEDYLIRHRGDRLYPCARCLFLFSTYMCMYGVLLAAFSFRSSRITLLRTPVVCFVLFCFFLFFFAFRVFFFSTFFFA